MFSLLRDVHAYCGLLLLLFIAMYAVTGVTLVHADLFFREAELETRTVDMDFAGDPSGSELYGYLEEELDARGRARPMRVTDDGVRTIEYERPGATVEFRVAADLGSVEVRAREGALGERLRQLHRLWGFRGGLAYAAWGLVMDLVSLAMIVFAVTGPLMWYMRTKDRRLGWTLLSVSWAFTVGLSAYLMLSP